MAQPDVIIIGAGISGAIMALELAKQKKNVLILDAGPVDPNSRKSFQDHFLKSTIKLPECPYPPYTEDPSQQCAPRYKSRMLFPWPGTDNASPLKAIADFNAQSHMPVSPSSQIPFLSTYERIVGGTTWHWLGTSLRLLPHDFKMQTTYGRGRDWPLSYDDLIDDYGRAEEELAVSGDVTDQDYLGIHFPKGYAYPMSRVVPTYSDTKLDEWMKGMQLSWLDNLEPRMASTPQARNSAPHLGRRACAGNNSCIPMCPIQAKYDATVTLQKAVNTGFVTVMPKTVVSKILVDQTSRNVTGVEAQSYDNENGPPSPKQTFTASTYVLAAHAIESPRLLLHSATSWMHRGVANSSDQVGRNLMDHVVYLGWGLAKDAVYPYRGPRSSSGIEALRDGTFRKNFAAFRVDVGNEGWGWADGDPNTITQDFIDGTNNSQTNPQNEKLFGSNLVKKLNHYLTRMVRFCYLVEQLPDPNNRVQLSQKFSDGMNIPRPEITYAVDGYTLGGLISAKRATEEIFQTSNIENKTVTRTDDGYPSVPYVNNFGKTEYINVFGAGHIVGTCRMGHNASDAVVTPHLQSHDHSNLFIIGSSVFPTIATGNPTLTIAALTYRASRKLLSLL